MRPSTTPTIVAWIPDSWRNTHIEIPSTAYNGVYQTLSRRNTITATAIAIATSSAS